MLPPFLQLAAAQRTPFSSFYQVESQEQMPGCTKPTKKQIS